MTETPGGLAIVRLTVLTDAQQGHTAFGSPTIYRVQNYAVRERGKEQDVTSTSDDPITPAGSAIAVAVAETTVVSTVGVEVMLKEASYAPDLNFFGAPNLIRVGSYLRAEIFPNGLTSTPWDITLQVTAVDHEGDAAALQPITLTGKSRGAWSRPA